MSGNVARQLYATIWGSSGAAFHNPLLFSARPKIGGLITTSPFKCRNSHPWPQRSSPHQGFASKVLVAQNSTLITSTTELGRSIDGNAVSRRLTRSYTTLDRRKSFRIFSLGTLRSRATGRRNRISLGDRRYKGSDTHPHDVSKVAKSTGQEASRAAPQLAPTLSKAATASTASKHLMDRLPNISQIHRPTKEELLAAATGFWSRLKIRFKWASIRSARPFNSDEIGAFFSWIILGHVVWIIVGTTTFFSLAIFAVNTVFAQETLARWVGNYLTKSSGVKVVFESAIVPKWGDGVITFKNVFVSRRPGQGTGRVSKGSPKTAAAAAAATVVADQYRSGLEVVEEGDTNFTQFDVSIETVNVTLSFSKWFNSKGLLRDVEVKGVRGVIDRTHVHWSDESIDPRSYRHEHNPGDFEIDSFKMEDLLVTIHQPNGFRPFPVSIFFCELPQLRRQWLFYDFLSANTMSGSFDDSLFTIHPHQMHGHTGSQVLQHREADGAPNPWKKHSRLRVDGLHIDHLNRGVEGPFSWIHEGNVDIIADVMFPADNDESIAKAMVNFYDQIEATVVAKKHLLSRESTSIINNDPSGAFDKSAMPKEDLPRPAETTEDRRFLIMNMKVHFNDVRAAVPLFTKDLSYVKNALIRPMVAYINSRHTFIPINCRVVKRVTDFDGSWTLFDSGLMDDLSAETYTAIAKDVTDDQAKLRRFKKVGLWSLQLAIQALFMGMAGNMA